MQTTLTSILSILALATSLSAAAGVASSEINVHVQARAIPSFSERTVQQFASDDRSISQGSPFVGSSGRIPAAFDHRNAVGPGGQLIDIQGRK